MRYSKVYWSYSNLLVLSIHHVEKCSTNNSPNSTLQLLFAKQLPVWSFENMQNNTTRRAKHQVWSTNKNHCLNDQLVFLARKSILGRRHKAPCSSETNSTCKLTVLRVEPHVISAHKRMRIIPCYYLTGPHNVRFILLWLNRFPQLHGSRCQNFTA
jgi:hypothetical protein